MFISLPKGLQRSADGKGFIRVVRDKKYQINFIDGQWKCDCFDCRYSSKKTCRHVKEVEKHLKNVNNYLEKIKSRQKKLF